MFSGADKPSTCVHVCARMCVCPPAHVCVLTSDGERMLVGKSFAVIERAPTGTRDWFWFCINH